MHNFHPRLTTFFYSKWYWVAWVYNMDHGFRTPFGGGGSNATLLAGPYPTKRAARRCLRRVRPHLRSWTERLAASYQNIGWRRDFLDGAFCTACNRRVFMHESGLERHRAANHGCRIHGIHEQ